MWPKERILEMYLNSVDWGGGIIGAQAAAQKYYDIDASRLDRSQAAAMAAILHPSKSSFPQRSGPLMTLPAKARLFNGCSIEQFRSR